MGGGRGCRYRVVDRVGMDGFFFVCLYLSFGVWVFGWRVEGGR